VVNKSQSNPHVVRIIGVVGELLLPHAATNMDTITTQNDFIAVVLDALFGD
jgi:hypothetical protein